MTVYESLVIWLNSILTGLKNNFPIKAAVIDLEIIPDWQEFANAGLFSSPNDLQDELIAGQRKYTEFKTLYLRLPFEQYQNRLKNEIFIEEFRKSIHEKFMDGLLPKDGREWINISISSGIYPAQRQPNNQFADYLIPLRVVYIE